MAVCLARFLFEALFSAFYSLLSYSGQLQQINLECEGFICPDHWPPFPKVRVWFSKIFPETALGLRWEILDVSGCTSNAETRGKSKYHMCSPGLGWGQWWSGQGCYCCEAENYASLRFRETTKAMVWESAEVEFELRLLSVALYPKWQKRH